jgi:hypothetical protein
MKRAAITIAVLLSLGLLVGTASSGPAIDWNKERTDAAAKAYAFTRAQLDGGLARPEQVYVWSLRWCESEGCSGKAADAHLDRMKQLEAKVSELFKGGLASQAEVAGAAYYQSDARLRAKK